jgi:hypothetical protein
MAKPRTCGGAYGTATSSCEKGRVAEKTGEHVMSDKFTFSSAGEIQEVEFALARAGATHPEVKELTKGKMLGLVMEVIRGKAEICRIERLASVEPIPEPTPWREQDGVIYFSVTSDGANGVAWIERLKNKGFRIGDNADRILRSGAFRPTSCITTAVAVLKGDMFSDNDRTTRNIRAKAGTRKLQKPNLEVACLIREKFTDEEIKAMGLTWIITMHEPVGVDGNLHLLGSRTLGGASWLHTYYDSPDLGWGRDGGFAFAVSQS